MNEVGQDGDRCAIQNLTVLGSLESKRVRVSEFEQLAAVSHSQTLEGHEI